MSFLNKYCQFEITKICKILLNDMPDKSYVRLEKPFSDNLEKSIYKIQSNDLNMINDKGFFKYKHGTPTNFNTLKGGELAKIYQQLIRGEFKVVKVKPFERVIVPDKTNKSTNTWKGKNWSGNKGVTKPVEKPNKEGKL